MCHDLVGDKEISSVGSQISPLFNGPSQGIGYTQSRISRRNASSRKGVCAACTEPAPALVLRGKAFLRSQVVVAEETLFR